MGKSAIKCNLTKLPIWIMLIITSFIACNCDNNTNIPRRKAYPRITTHDSAFSTITSLPLHFERSSIALITLDSTIINNKTEEKSHWINLFYKPYNITIHCTFTRIDTSTIYNTLYNRKERMALNSGNFPSELIELTNANNFSSQILITEQSKVTPLQFLSTNNKNWVVSGALYLNNNNTPNIDSIRPIINVVKRDIIHSLKTISDP